MYSFRSMTSPSTNSIIDTNKLSSEYSCVNTIQTNINNLIASDTTHSCTMNVQANTNIKLKDGTNRYTNNHIRRDEPPSKKCRIR